MGGTRCLVVECCSDGAGVLGRIASGEGVTDVVIGYLNDEREHIVFMLWGDTQKKGAFFDRLPILRLYRLTGDFSVASISVKLMNISEAGD